MNFFRCLQLFLTPAIPADTIPACSGRRCATHRTALVQDTQLRFIATFVRTAAIGCKYPAVDAPERAQNASQFRAATLALKLRGRYWAAAATANVTLFLLNLLNAETQLPEFAAVPVASARNKCQSQ